MNQSESFVDFFCPWYDCQSSIDIKFLNYSGNVYFKRYGDIRIPFGKAPAYMHFDNLTTSYVIILLPTSLSSSDKGCSRFSWSLICFSLSPQLMKAINLLARLGRLIFTCLHWLLGSLFQYYSMLKHLLYYCCFDRNKMNISMGMNCVIKIELPCMIVQFYKRITTLPKLSNLPNLSVFFLFNNGLLDKLVRVRDLCSK